MSIDWAVVLATVAGPVLAVQVQKFIERSTSKRQRRERIFEAIMTNRATRLSSDYIQALNQIDLEFRARSDKPVVDAWRSLFGELSNPPPDQTDANANTAWNDRCNERLIALLVAMGKVLGRVHSDEEIRRGFYYPRGRVEAEQAQLAVLIGLQRVLDGSSPLNVQNAGPGPSDLQLSVLKKIAAAYDDSGALKVIFANAPDKSKMN
ncbi:DUF6680 family protein [Bradyrhizobium sp.]|uniref:DUF6680 family protein n=1 Tax=Bradyrhizobium sp. TaxID=376 RepID=UPI0039E2994A